MSHVVQQRQRNELYKIMKGEQKIDDSLFFPAGNSVANAPVLKQKQFLPLSKKQEGSNSVSKLPKITTQQNYQSRSITQADAKMSSITMFLDKELREEGDDF
jgi:hypothetical protein